MSYSPFGKSIFEDIGIEDLQRLIDDKVTEGYVIEFKSPGVNNRKIAKTIASFANTYGGWLTFGIAAKNRVASAICGYDKDSYPKQDERIRSVASSRIDPVPIVYCRIIDIDSNNCVLIAYIPRGEDTPYITSDGRIYRRHLDSSEPIAETDRHAVDLLIEKGDSSRKHFEEFCKQEYDFQIGHDQQVGWVNVFIEPIPFGEIYRPEFFATKGISDLIKLSQEQLSIPFFNQGDMQTRMPFEFGQTTHESVILRQFRPEEKDLSQALGMQLYVDGRARFHIPIEIIDNFIEKLSATSVESLACENLLERLSQPEGSYRNLMFFNFAIIWQLLISFLFIYQKAFRGTGEPESVKAAIILRNSSGYVPYLEYDEWFSHVEEFGLPLIMNDFVRIPSAEGRGVLVEFDDMSWVALSFDLCLSVGLPRKQLIKYWISLMGGDEKVLDELRTTIDTNELL